MRKAGNREDVGQLGGKGAFALAASLSNIFGFWQDWTLKNAA